MNFQLSEDQQMLRDTFARFLDEQSSMPRVRAALPSGFDASLWSGLAELGAFSLRAPEAAGGMGLGLLDAAILMEEVGRTLASGPIAETLVAARLLATLGGQDELLERVLAGQAVVTIALHDIAKEPVQWVAGGAVAEAVIARDNDRIVLVSIPESERKGELNLASTPIAELRLGGAEARSAVQRRCGSKSVCAGRRGMEAVDRGRARRVVARVAPPCRCVRLRACRVRSAHRRLSGDLASPRRSQHRSRRRQIPDLESDPGYRGRARRRRAPRSRWRRGGTSIPRRAPSRRRCIPSAVTDSRPNTTSIFTTCAPRPGR